jgi:hypothetical protein
MIVERTFRETRMEKNFQKGATFFRAGAFVALDMGGSRLSAKGLFVPSLKRDIVPSIA